MKQESQLIYFEDYFLAATAHYPEKYINPKQAVFFCHGFTGNRIEARRLFVKFARILTKTGIAAFTFDYRGHGESSGDFEEFSFKDWIKDAFDAYDFFKKNICSDINNISILGYSMGGGIASYLAAERETKNLVLWAPLSNPYQLYKSRITNLSDEEKNNYAKRQYLDSGGFKISRSFIEILKEINPIEKIINSKAEDIIILQADDDKVLPYTENSMIYYDALIEKGKKVSLINIPNGGHSFASVESESMLFNKSVEFLLRK